MCGRVPWLSTLPLSADRAAGRKRDDQDPQGDAVGDEYRERVVRQVSKEPGDGRVARGEGHHRRDDRRTHGGTVAAADVAQLEEAAEDDGWHREQEGVAGGRGPVEVAEQP